MADHAAPPGEAIGQSRPLARHGLRTGHRAAGLDTSDENRLHTARYSRFVSRTKLILPITAGGLVLVLAIWPYISASLDRLHVGFTKIDLSEAHDLRMVNASYTGLDKEKRPFTVTAEIARQAPDDDLIALDKPKADMLTKEGAWLALAGNTGMYQSQTHLLDLFGDVTLFHGKGYQFKSASARIDLQSGDAVGSEPVTGEGPSGTLQGQGFRLLRKGDVVVFTGKSHMTLVSSKTSDHPATPPAAPPSPPPKPPSATGKNSKGEQHSASTPAHVAGAGAKQPSPTPKASVVPSTKQ